jgi:WD40 repeat protein
LELGRSVSVWDTAAAQESYRIVAPAGPERVGVLAINPSCTRAAYTVGKYGQPLDVAIYSRGRETPDTRFSTGLNSFAEVQFSPDGRLLAILGDENRFVSVWDSFTGEEIVTLRGHRNRIERIAFGPDSRRLAIASAGGRVAIWDVTRTED